MVDKYLHYLKIIKLTKSGESGYYDFGLEQLLYLLVFYPTNFEVVAFRVFFTIQIFVGDEDV
jgi:hypothetical protein